MKIQDYSVNSFANSKHTKEQMQSLRIEKVPTSFVFSQPVKSCDETFTDIPLDPKQMMMVRTLERLMGRKIDIKSLQFKEKHTSNVAPKNVQPSSPTIIYESSQKEVNSAHFGFKGSVQTEDGKSISFDLSIKIHEEFASSNRIIIGEQGVMEDPLIISLDGKNPVTAQKFDFDLNKNAQSLNFLENSSGYLAIDKNLNGKIDNGTELFGPSTSDGFAELGDYDEDGNGWIDENDSAFKQLKFWHPTKDEDQNIISLKEAGVGAISLFTEDLNYTTKSDIETPLANLKEASVALGEQGESFVVFSVDLSV